MCAPAGSFLPIPGAASVEDCQPCPAGWFCSLAGLSSPEALCEGGWYRPPASVSGHSPGKNGPFLPFPVGYLKGRHKPWDSLSLDSMAPGLCRRGEEYCALGKLLLHPEVSVCSEMEMETPGMRKKEGKHQETLRSVKDREFVLWRRE